MHGKGRWLVALMLVVVIGGGGFLYLNRDRRQPGKAIKQVDLGNAALSAGRFDDAKHYFLKAIDYDDHNIAAHYNLGYVYQTIDNAFPRATTQYREVLKLDPRHVQSLYSLATIRARLQDKDEAIQLYRQAIAADATYADAYFNLGLLLIDTGKKDEGNADLEKAVQLKPELGAKLPHGVAK